MSEGFPLLTTKKMYTKGIITELLWFLRGDTNIKYLLQNKCNIWTGDAHKNYMNKGKLCVGDNQEYGNLLTEEEFIEQIKTDDEFAKKWGELGPVYGKQWRKWSKFGSWDEYDALFNSSFTVEGFENIDQFTNVINKLKTNPDDRRMMVTAWNPADVDKCVLPPCHYGFQVWTRELTKNQGWERYELLLKKTTEKELSEKYKDDERANWLGFRKFKLEDANYICDKENVPTRAVSLLWNQRSVDTLLGLPFNIASYGLLLSIIGEIVNMVPDELVGNLGDTHLYLNHIEQAREQIGSDIFENGPTCFDKTTFEPKQTKVKIGHTREPYPLPKLVINTEFWVPGTEAGCLGVAGTYSNDINELIKGMEITDFKVENYQSHGKIKAELSN